MQSDRCVTRMGCDTSHAPVSALRAILCLQGEAWWMHLRYLCTVSEIRANIISKYDLKKEVKKKKQTRICNTDVNILPFSIRNLELGE